MQITDEQQQQIEDEMKAEIGHFGTAMAWSSQGAWSG